jgi:hypothetical protein
LRFPAIGGTFAASAACHRRLLPYLDDHWKEQVVSRAIDGLDLTSYPPRLPLSGRSDLAAGPWQAWRILPLE